MAHTMSAPSASLSSRLSSSEESSREDSSCEESSSEESESDSEEEGPIYDEEDMEEGSASEDSYLSQGPTKYNQTHSPTHTPKASPPPCLDAFEEEDMFSLWRGGDGHEDFPDHMVECPFEKEALGGFYMLNVEAHPTYKEQEDCIKEAMLNPPLNLTLLSTMSETAKRQKLSPYEVSEWGMWLGKWGDVVRAREGEGEVSGSNDCEREWGNLTHHSHTHCL